MTQSQHSIEAKSLTRQFGTTLAVDQLDLNLECGGVTALLGPNGAGKTTFIRMALGLTRLSAGSLSVLGTTPGSLAARQQTGVMLQEAQLPDLLTPREHLELFASYYPNPRDIDEVLSLCRIEGFADTRYKKLSGGQKRRAQFALAIVGQPSIIFLDEPTTGLDIEARRALWEVIRTLTDSGASIILTTHYLEEAEALADRVIVIDHGRIITNQTTQALMGTMASKVIQCKTSLDDATLLALTGVNSVHRLDKDVHISCARATVTLRELLNLDQDLSNLRISQPTLEQIFTNLTAANQEASA